MVRRINKCLRNFFVAIILVICVIFLIFFLIPYLLDFFFIVSEYSRGFAYANVQIEKQNKIIEVIEAKNLSLCEELESSGYNCKEQFAVAYNDLALCKSLNVESRARCLYKIAMNLKDIGLCNELGKLSMDSNYRFADSVLKDADACLANIAVELKDASLCENANDTTFCLEIYTYGTKNN